MKNKTVLIALGVVALVLVVLGGVYFMGNKSAPKAQEESSEAQVKTLSPDAIGLKLEATPDKKKVKFTISKAQGITAIEYELTYEADSTAQEQSEGGDSRVQRGITGQGSVKEGETSFESDDLDLGSCSRNVCRYDTGVKKVDMTLKLTKSDGSVYNVEDSLAL